MTASTSASSALPHFSWWPALVGGVAAMGASALLGTLVTNASLWFFMSQGLSVQEAYARMGSNITSPVELLSLAMLGLSGVFGGYVSALYGGGRHIVQGTAAGVVSTVFFLAMSLSPVSQAVPGWYLPVSMAGAIIAGLVGGCIHGRNA
jgi:hypothetical protein